MAQTVNNLPVMQEMQVQSLVAKIPWRRAWHPIPVFLPGESHGQRSLAGYLHGVAKSQTELNDQHLGNVEIRLKDITKKFHIFVPSLASFPRVLYEL